MGAAAYQRGSRKIQRDTDVTIAQTRKSLMGELCAEIDDLRHQLILMRHRAEAAEAEVSAQQATMDAERERHAQEIATLQDANSMHRETIARIARAEESIRHQHEKLSAIVRCGMTPEAYHLARADAVYYYQHIQWDEQG